MLRGVRVDVVSLAILLIGLDVENFVIEGVRSSKANLGDSLKKLPEGMCKVCNVARKSHRPPKLNPCTSRALCIREEGGKLWGMMFRFGPALLLLKSRSNQTCYFHVPRL